MSYFQPKLPAGADAIAAGIVVRIAFI